MSEINNAPTVNAGVENQNAAENNVFIFTLPSDVFADADVDDSLSLSASLDGGGELPAWLTFNGTTFSGTPDNEDVGAINIAVTATDLAGETVTTTFVLTVANTNDAPTVAVELANQTATEDTGFSFTVPTDTFADIDVGDSLTLTATLADGTALPTWLDFTDGTFSGIPLNEDVGTLSVRVTATDGSGATASDIFTLTTANTNDAPTVDGGIGNQDATENSLFLFTVPGDTFADVDAEDSLTLTATLEDGSALPAWLTFDGTVFFGTPDNADVGSLTVTVTATDGAGATVTETFDLAVANTNDVPTLETALADQTTAEDDLFSFTIPANTFADIDAEDSLTLTATLADGTALPAWLTFTEGTFSGVPSNDDVGELTVTVTAMDEAGAMVSDTFVLTITNTNDGPELAEGIADQSAPEDAVFVFNVPGNAFADVDEGDSLTFTATLEDGSALPTWLTFNGTTFFGTPDNADVGSLSVTVTATDSAGETATATFGLEVTNTNDAPTVAVAVADQTTAEDDLFSFTVPAGTFADVDAGDSLTLTATLADGSALPDWLTFTDGTFTGSPSNDEVGELEVTVTATDLAGERVSDTFTLTITNTNDGPTVAEGIVDQIAPEDAVFVFNVPGDAFADVDAGDSLALTATLADGSALPDWLTFEDGIFRGTPRNGDVDTLTVLVTASDGAGETVTATFELAVTNTNDAPTVAAVLADQTVAEDDLFSFTVPEGTFADVDAADSLTLTATLADGSTLPTWLTFTDGTFSGVPLNEDVGTISVTVTATDLAGDTVSDTFTLTITNTNDGPTVDVGIGPQEAPEDSPFVFILPNDVFADVDVGDSLTLTATLADGSALPGWLTFNGSSFSGTPTNDDVGTLSITVTATDTAGATTSETFDLAVTNTNDAPILVTELANQDASENDAFVFTIPAGTFTDVDAGDGIVLNATLADGSALPGWLTFDGSTFSGTPTDADVGTISVTVTATDGDGATASDTFSITTTNTNDAPTVGSGIEDQTATEDSVFIFILPEDAFTDGDGDDTLTLEATLVTGDPLPEWLDFDGTTFSGTPTNDDVDTLAVTVTATDEAGAQVAETFDLVVANTNDAPTLEAALTDQNATEGSAFVFSLPAGTFADVDAGDSLTIGATQADGSALPTWLSFNGTTFSGVPTNDDVGTLTITVTATDLAGAMASSTFEVVVANTNDAPTLDSPIAEQNATEDVVFSFAVPEDTFGDVDAADSLDLQATLADGSALPDWLTFTNSVFSGTPTNANVGTLAITVTATDAAGAAVSNTFDLVVANTNDAPTLDNPIADQNAAEDSIFVFTVPAATFSDVDAEDSLTLTATLEDGSALPDWLDFTDGTFSGVPTNDDVGTLAVVVTATDLAGDTASTTFDLAIANTNDPPTLGTPITDQNATEDSPFVFAIPDGTFGDVDAEDSLTLTATLEDGSDLPDWLTLEGTLLSGTPTNGDVGTLSVTVTAQDTAGATVSDTFDITVANVNDAPTLETAITNQAATEGTIFVFTLPTDTFDDVDAGDDLTFTATLADGSALPAWLDFTDGTFSGVPTNDDVGTLQVTVTATDLAGETATSTFDLAVANVNDAPTLETAITNQDATEDSPFVFAIPDGTFDDVDAGDSLTLTATLADGSALPAWLTFENGIFTGAPVNADVGTIAVTVTAQDAAGATVSSTFDLTVANVNDAPTLEAPLTDQNATEDAAFVFTVPDGTFEDVDAEDDLTLTATLADGSALPAWLNFTNGTFSGVPTNADVGTLEVIVTATDLAGETVTSAFDLVVANTNDAPTLVTPISDPAATEDLAFSFEIPTGTFADEDAGDSLSLGVTLENGTPLPAWLTFDASSGTLNGTPTNGDVGTLTLTVTATDTAGETASQTFDLVVANTNDAPTLASPIAEQTAVKDSAFIFAIPAGTFDDVDAGDSLTLTATLEDGSALPAWLDFTDGTFSGAPTADDIADLTVTVTATDLAGATTSTNFSLAVVDTNNAPTVASPIADQTAIESRDFAFVIPEGTFVDVDPGDTLTLTASLADGNDLPTWLSFDGTAFSGTPLETDLGNVSIVVTATDEVGETVTTSFDLTVANSNSSGDLNGDGSADILWRDTTTGSNFAWFLDAGTVTSGELLPSLPDLTWTLRGLGDFDADGSTDDLLWYNTVSGDIYTWTTEVIDGNINVTGANLLGNFTPSNAWQLTDVSDFDGDGNQDDLLWFNTDTAEINLWITENSAVVDTESIGTNLENTGWAVVGAGDFSGDGTPDDLLWRNSITGENVVWLLEDSQAKDFAVLTPEANTNWQVAGISDFSGDGTANDILWRNSATGGTGIWLLDDTNAFTGFVNLGTVGTEWQPVV